MSSYRFKLQNEIKYQKKNKNKSYMDMKKYKNERNHLEKNHGIVDVGCFCILMQLK